jgi:hypothetical protein
MRENLEFIKITAELNESQIFRDDYINILGDNNGTTYNSPFHKELDDIFNNIMMEFRELTDFQLQILYSIFNSFNAIRKVIDPNRLSSFSYFYTDDCELLLYRKTEKGLTNIIIDSEDCLAYSFIGVDKNKILTFLKPNDDFEQLAYKFFSN